MSDPKKQEGIRSWYERTISRSRRALLVATVVSTVVMAAMWILAPTHVIARLQTFNGALTIPLWGGLWIAGFIFMFLIPSREASFRAQEAVEQLTDQVQDAAKIWREIGLEVKKDLPAIVAEFRSSAQRIGEAVATIKEIAKKNEELAIKANPALDTLARISDRIEHEMKAGIVEDFRNMTEAVKMMGGIGPMPSTVRKPSDQNLDVPPKKPSDPNLGIALKNISKKKENVSNL